MTCDQGAVRKIIRIINQVGAYGYARAARCQDLGDRDGIRREGEIPLP